MKKLSLILALMPFLAWAQLDKKLQNTIWEIKWHQGNADTYAFVKVPADKKEPSRKFLAFQPGNRYQFYYYFNENCETDVRGKYAVEKSHIDFTTESSTNGKKCGDDRFELAKQSLVFRGDKLYMTPHKPFYDEAPKKSGDTLLIPLEMVGRLRGEGNNFYTITDASYIPFEDGLYKATDHAGSAKIIFGIKNTLPEGRYISESSDRKYEMLLRKGRSVQEKTWRDGQLALTKTNTAKVEKQGADYLITLTKATHNFFRDISDSTITVYRNKLPVSIISYEAGVLKSEKDYDKKTFKQYYSNGKIKEISEPYNNIKYDYQGNEEERETRTGTTTEYYYKGKLVKKREVSGKKIVITAYDSAGKITATTEEPVQEGNVAMVADPREYAEDLTDDDFAYYTSE